MTTVVVLACVLIIVILLITILDFYRAKVKQQQAKIETLQQENEDLRKKYDEALGLVQRFQRQKAMKANNAADAIQNVRDGPNMQN